MARTDNFKKFEKKPKGSAVKEKLKQEKKKEKKERAAAIEAHFARKREEKLRMKGIDPAQVPDRKFAGKPAPKSPADHKKPFSKREEPASRNTAPKRDNDNRKTFDKPGASPDKKRSRAPKKDVNKGKPASKREAPFTPRATTTPPASKTFSERSEGENKSSYPKKSFEKSNPAVKPETPFSRDNNSKSKTPSSQSKPHPEHTQAETAKPSFAKKEFDKSKPGGKHDKSFHRDNGSRQSSLTPVLKSQDSKPKHSSSSALMPLNKYIAHSGVCARRDAAEIVKQGKVTVNGELVVEPGHKVSENDTITVSGKVITISKNFVYILLNKPKDYITTAEDPQGRKTVLDLVRTATSERVYPVGRLDRNTSGVLLLTNDGDLAQKLSHPKHEIKKVYEVRLDRPLTRADMEKIASGIELEDGFIAPDVIAYADSKDKSIIGIEIHSGRNRIVRRIFEHMKYDVKQLDRVMFAGLTKKDVLRGNWRFLKEKEVRLLKYMNQSFVKVKS